VAPCSLFFFLILIMGISPLIIPLLLRWLNFLIFSFIILSLILILSWWRYLHRERWLILCLWRLFGFLRTHIPNRHCRRFNPGGSLDRRVNCRCVSQPRWVGVRWNTRGEKGNRDSCYPTPMADALAVGGYKRSRGRERACSSARPPARPPFRMRALDLPFIDVRRRPRCTMGGVAMC
jgi:hypothetical protein